MLTLWIAFKPIPMSLEVFQKFSRALQIVVRDWRQSFHFKLKLDPFLQVFLFIGKETIVPTCVHTLDNSTYLRQSFLQALFSKQLAHGMRQPLSPFLWWLEAHERSHYLPVEYINGYTYLFAVVAEISCSASIVHVPAAPL